MSKLYINHPNYQRIKGKELLHTTANSVCELIRNTVPSTVLNQIHFVKQLEFKEDFGDIDLIVYVKDEQKFIEIIKSIDYFTDVSYNDHTLSVLFFPNGSVGLASGHKENAYHVDFILRHTEQDFQNAIHYYSNGVVVNFVGQFLKWYHIKFGFNGVFYEYQDSNNDRLAIKINNNISDFLNDYFIERDKPWNKHFQSFEEVIHYLETLEIFPGAQIYKDIASTDKKRSLKRHGMAHDIYNKLLESKVLLTYCGKNRENFLWQMDYLNIIKEESFLHEQDLVTKSVKKKCRNMIETFIQQNNISNNSKRELFEVLRPSLEKFHGILD